MDLNLLFPTIEQAYIDLAPKLEKAIGLSIEPTLENLEAIKEMFPEITKVEIPLYMRGYNAILDQLLKDYPQTVDVLWQAQRRGKKITLPDTHVEDCGFGPYSGGTVNDNFVADIARYLFETNRNTIPLDKDPCHLLAAGTHHPIIDPVLEVRVFRTSNKKGNSVLSFWDYREEAPTRFCSESLGVS